MSANITIAKHFTDTPIHIDLADNGQSCNCTCYDCGEPLLAVQGKSKKNREWHFRHLVESNCTGAQESSLHKLAKHILQNSTSMIIPKYGRINYTNCLTECRYLERIPDVQATLEIGEMICFEIFNKHAVDTAKAIFYKSNQCKSLEIDLKNCPTEKYEEIKSFLLNEVNGKWVIFWEQPEVNANEVIIKNNQPFLDWKIVAFILFLVFLLTKAFSRSETKEYNNQN
nr:hypothetical protein [Pedobacter panaciterrae]